MKSTTLLSRLGFDISAEQFPRTSTPGNEFVIWDMTTTFPPEYHGTFDVVHIRFTVLALTSEQIKIVVGNLVELLSKICYPFLFDSRPPNKTVANRNRAAWISSMDRYILQKWSRNNTSS